MYRFITFAADNLAKYLQKCLQLKNASDEYIL